MNVTFDSCVMCDTLIFGSKFIKIENDILKIKVCSQQCFEKYMIMVEQRAMKSRKIVKKEETKKTGA